MHTTELPTHAAHLRGMGDIEKERRGAAIKRRRLALGINGYREFAEATADAGIKDKGTVWRAENGTASESTYDKLEAWLDRMETETGMDGPEVATPIKVEMHGVFGVDKVIVSGPVEHPDELAEAVGKILDRIRAGERPQVP